MKRTLQSFSQAVLLTTLFWASGFSQSYLRAQCHPDFDALIALYNATNGPGWTNNTGWAAGAAGENCDVCTWYGVSCYLNRVYNIQIPSNNLVGTIPTEIGNLSYLGGLDLSSNHLSGTIPASIGNLYYLSGLILNNNQLSGSIPPELGNNNFDYFAFLILSNNQLSGSIPPELGNLTDAWILSLNHNQLSGSIPPELGNLSSPVMLDLAFNELTGSIPPELGNLSSNILSELYLNDNQLSGCFPQELSSFCSIYTSFTGNPGLPGGGDFAAFCDTGVGACHDDDDDGITNEDEIACGSDPLNNASTCEVCDGMDNDLDGLTDDDDPSVDGQTTWYADTDGDGYGNASSPVSACVQPAGYVSDNSDCNDTNGAVYPLADEACNGLDDNCDGIIPSDEADSDGDGYRVCQNDCNDEDATIHPGAEEICSNTIDDDCDGLVNEGCGAALTVDAGTCQVVFYGYAPQACTTLTAAVSGGIIPYSYSWSDGSTSASTSVCPNATTIYSVTVTDDVGTTAVNGVMVEVMDVHCGNNNDKVLVCHTPANNEGNPNTLCVGESAVADHLGHGDYLGDCGNTSPCSGGQNFIIHNSNDIPIATAMAERAKLTLIDYYGKANSNEDEVLIKVNPNPADDYIELETNFTEGVISIIDVSGKVVLRQGLSIKYNILNTGELMDGIYFLRMQNGVDCFIRSIVVIH